MAEFEFSQLDALMRAGADHGIPGCAVAVSVRGKRVFEKYYGFADRNLSRPTDKDTVYTLYSMSKLYTNCAALQLIEKGLLGLDDPVAKWLPAYADIKVREGDTVRPAHNTLTVRHLMAMQGGFDYDFRADEIKAVLAKYGEEATTRQIIDGLAAKPLCFDPGSRFQYSLCHDVLAAVAEAVSGMRFRDYVKRNVLDPLGVRDMAYHLRDLPRPENAGDLFMYDNEKQTSSPMESNKNDFIVSEEYDCGGAGLYGTLEAYIRFAETISMDGGSLLRPETVDLWHTDQQTIPGPRESWAGLNRKGYGYALGVRTRIVPDAPSPYGEFGWDGAAGSYVMIDTVNQIAAVYLQNVLGCGYAFDRVHNQVRDAVYSDLKINSK